ncbi:hypothetical protein Tco_0353477 [Tanacetum coccineum]
MENFSTTSKGIVDEAMFTVAVETFLKTANKEPGSPSPQMIAKLQSCFAPYPSQVNMSCKAGINFKWIKYLNAVLLEVELVLKLLKGWRSKAAKSWKFLSIKVLPEHPSDTKVLTMKMEILLEPTSNKLLVGKYGDSDGYTFDDPILILEILSRRFLLRGIYLITGSSKDGDGDTSFQWSQFTTQCSHLMFPKDIQCAGSDTRPPMLDKTDFASWQQRIRLYCRGKENGVNILKSIDEGPISDGDHAREEGKVHIRHFGATELLLRFTKDIYSLINHYTDAKDIWDNVEDLFGMDSELSQGRPVVVQNVHGRQNRDQGNMPGVRSPFMGEHKQSGECYARSNAIDEDVDEQPVQDLALNVDNVFQADDCDAYDSDVDELPTSTNIVHTNLSSADPDAICEHYEEHEMQVDVQPSYVVGSHADYTSDSNMTPYDQYVKDNAVPVVQNNASTVPNDMAQDIVKMKAEALKEQNTRPIKALTVYPPNTPATLVPRVLPTKSQVKNYHI